MRGLICFPHKIHIPRHCPPLTVCLLARLFRTTVAKVVIHWTEVPVI